jgi:hypothetical protein
MNRNNELAALRSLNSSFDKSDLEGIPLRGDKIESTEEEDEQAPLFATAAPIAIGRCEVLKFKDIQSKRVEQQINRIRSEMWIDCLTIAVLLVAMVYEGTSIRCGIRLVTWSSIFMLAMFIRIAISTTRTFIFTHFPDMGPLYSFVSFLIIDGFILSW